MTQITDPAALNAELARIRHAYNTVRLHASIGYVTPDDEHHGRGPAIRRARIAGAGAPRVTAKGKGRLADIMRELAREHSIPIIEDIPLARLLYRRVKVGRTVPAETYRAVAAILAFVYRVLGRSGAAQVRIARGAA